MQVILSCENRLFACFCLDWFYDLLLLQGHGKGSSIDPEHLIVKRIDELHKIIVLLSLELVLNVSAAHPVDYVHDILQLLIVCPFLIFLIRILHNQLLRVVPHKDYD